MFWLDTDSRSDRQIRQLPSHIRHSFQHLIHNIKLQYYLRYLPSIDSVSKCFIENLGNYLELIIKYIGFAGMCGTFELFQLNIIGIC